MDDGDIFGGLAPLDAIRIWFADHPLLWLLAAGAAYFLLHLLFACPRCGKWFSRVSIETGSRMSWSFRHGLRRHADTLSRCTNCERDERYTTTTRPGPLG